MMYAPFVLSCLTWLVTFLVGLVTFVFARHYMKVRSLPPGPFPLPIIGNILKLRGEGVIFQQVLMKYGKKYNNLFTFWIGSSPTVIVMSWDLCKEALITRRNDFSGRVVRKLTKKLMKGAKDIIGCDYGPCWETLRKLLVAAVRKYSVSDKLADLVAEVVDISVEKMLKEDTPVEGLGYAYLMVLNIIASSAFGQRYDIDDAEFVELRKNSEDMFEAFMDIAPAMAIPLLEPFYKKKYLRAKGIFDKTKGVISGKFHEHKRTFQKGIVRDFTDALIQAKEEAEEEGKDSSEYLVDENLIHVLGNFFSAGTDTTKTHLLWILLIICNKPEIQKKMQAEIDANIGSRRPRQQDKRVCHYTQAVIIETLRFRPTVELSLEHKTICDTEVGGQKIPKDTACLFHILNVQRDKDIWDDAEEFKPERLLDENGRMNTNRLDGYMPFGIGRRACPGEKLALADVFLIVVRLLQQVDLELENGPGSVDLTPEPKNFASIPKKFNLVAKKRT